MVTVQAISLSLNFRMSLLRQLVCRMLSRLCVEEGVGVHQYVKYRGPLITKAGLI